MAWNGKANRPFIGQARAELPGFLKPGSVGACKAASVARDRRKGAAGECWPVAATLCVAAADALSRVGGVASNFHEFTHSARGDSEVYAGSVPITIDQIAIMLTSLRTKL